MNNDDLANFFKVYFAQDIPYSRVRFKKRDKHGLLNKSMNIKHKKDWLFGSDAKWIPIGCILFAIALIIVWILS